MKISSEVEKIKRSIENAELLKSAAEVKKENIKTRIEELNQKQKDIQEAKYIVQEVAKDIQNKIQFRVSELASMAMRSVFDDPYTANVEFSKLSQANVFFEKDGERFVPRDDEVGGGVVDVASLAFQITLWSLENPRSRPVLILDEPMKWLKGGDLPEKGADLIKKLSTDLGIQVIMVSHDPSLIECADKVFKIQKDKEGVSHVST